MTLVVAVDWSGASKDGGRRDIALATARNGRLESVRAGFSRGEIEEWLIRKFRELNSSGDDRMAIGLDFAFSLPEWFLREELGVDTVADLWRRVSEDGDRWLTEKAPWPFWGRGESLTSSGLDSERALRRTEIEAAAESSTKAKSVFQLVGSGQVGPGSLRGMPMLSRLREEGFAIWPFDAPGRAVVVEIYPRALTGPVIKSDAAARSQHVARLGIDEDALAAQAASTEHAFDAAYSAVVMSKAADEIFSLDALSKPYSLEGKIWEPREPIVLESAAAVRDAPTERLTAMECRQCGRSIAPNPGVSIRTAATAERTTAYRCACGWAYSNAVEEANRIEIAPSPEDNVPPQVRPGLLEVLEAACNVGNRQKKQWSFRSERSEDALTWTVFRFLQESGNLERVLPDSLRTATQGQPPEMLLWGSSVPPGAAHGLADVLEQVSKCIGEHPERRTEPDIVLAWPDLVVFIEAKYGSGNVTGSDPEKHALYHTPHLFRLSIAETASADRYELVRNWRLGNELAVALGADRFALLNLGRPALSKSFGDFGWLIRTSDRRHAVHRTWSEILNGADRPDWLTDYLARRRPDDR